MGNILRCTHIFVASCTRSYFKSVKSLSAHLSSGVHTSDILTVYISAIKALRELDPSMVILQVACQPIRKYLRCLHLYWMNFSLSNRESEEIPNTVMSGNVFT